MDTLTFIFCLTGGFLSPMANVKFQHPYEQFRGRDSVRSSSYGNVAMIRTGVPLTRVFTSPNQPNSFAQNYSRLAFQTASITWSGLTNTEKDNWQTLANTITRTNPAGFTYTPSARSVFVQSYITSIRDGSSFPSPPTVPWIKNFTLPATFAQRGTSGGLPGVFITLIDTPIAGHLCIDVAGPLNPSVRSFKGLSFVFPGWLAVDAPAWGGGPPNFPPKVDDFVFYTNISSPNPFFVNDLWTQLNFAAGTRWAFRITPVDQQNLLPGDPQYSILDIQP